jgi:hypothetical protein
VKPDLGKKTLDLREQQWKNNAGTNKTQGRTLNNGHEIKTRSCINKRKVKQPTQDAKLDFY